MKDFEIKQIKEETLTTYSVFKTGGLLAPMGVENILVQEELRKLIFKL